MSGRAVAVVHQHPRHDPTVRHRLWRKRLAQSPRGSAGQPDRRQRNQSLLLPGHRYIRGRDQGPGGTRNSQAAILLHRSMGLQEPSAR